MAAFGLEGRAARDFFCGSEFIDNKESPRCRKSCALRMRRSGWTCASGRKRPHMTFALGEARTWAQILGPYRTPDVSRSISELLVTAVPFVLLWALMWATLGVGYWLCLLLALPTACFLMRLFMIQHDCGHGACFRRRATNDWVGRVIGVVTLTPYSVWLRGHALRKILDRIPAVAALQRHDDVHPFAAGGLDQRCEAQLVEECPHKSRPLHHCRPGQGGVRIEIEDPDPKIFRMGTTAVTTIMGFTPSQGAK